MQDNRARQFLPFNGLRGYDELLCDMNRERQARRPRSEAREEKLDAVLKTLKKKDRITVTWYDLDAYRTKRGILTELDPVFRVLKVGGETIRFGDLWWVGKEE